MDGGGSVGAFGRPALSRRARAALFRRPAGSREPRGRAVGRRPLRLDDFPSGNVALVFRFPVAYTVESALGGDRALWCRPDSDRLASLWRRFASRRLGAFDVHGWSLGRPDGDVVSSAGTGEWIAPRLVGEGIGARRPGPRGRGDRDGSPRPVGGHPNLCRRWRPGNHAGLRSAGRPGRRPPTRRRRLGVPQSRADARPEPDHRAHRRVSDRAAVRILVPRHALDHPSRGVASLSGNRVDRTLVRAGPAVSNLGQLSRSFGKQPVSAFRPVGVRMVCRGRGGAMAAPGVRRDDAGRARPLASASRAACAIGVNLGGSPSKRRPNSRADRRGAECRGRRGGPSPKRAGGIASERHGYGRSRPPAR